MLLPEVVDLKATVPLVASKLRLVVNLLEKWRRDQARDMPANLWVEIEHDRYDTIVAALRAYSGRCN